MTTTTKTILIAAVIAIVAIIAYVTIQPITTEPAVSGNTATSTVIDLTTSTSGVTISNEAMKIVQPKYDAPITFGKNIAADEKILINKKLEEFRALLRTDKYDFSAWVALGATYKIGGDYQRALAIWEYAGKAWPANIVSFANLGDLYANFLKDYPKAETNLLQAIKNNATDASSYRSLFTLYSETSYKPTNTAAEDLLIKYLATNPQAYDMRVLLARYYVKIGKPTEAKAQFELAAKSAAAAGKADVAAELRTEGGLK